jgi:hypothetical protein
MSATQLTGRQIKDLGGDISGQGNAVSVDKIKGTPISATAPTPGQALVFDGAQWAPSAGSGGVGGSGVAGQVAYWSNGTDITGSTAFTFSPTDGLTVAITASGSPGAVSISAAHNSVSGPGGSINLAAGNGADSFNSGGDITLTGGNPGASSGGAPGAIRLLAGTNQFSQAGSRIVVGNALVLTGAAEPGVDITLTFPGSNDTGRIHLNAGFPNGSIRMSTGVLALVIDSAGLSTFTGQVKIVDGTQGATKVFTSDANGLGSWQTPTGGPASALATTGADVVVSSAAPPTTGQVLTATSATAANWQTPSGGGSNPYTGSGAFVVTNTWNFDDGAPNYSPETSDSMVYDGTDLWMMGQGGNFIRRVSLSGQVLNTYTIPEGPVEMIFAFSHLWIVCDSITLYKVDPATGSVVSTYVSGKQMRYLTSNATYIFASSGQSGDPVVYRFDPVAETFHNLFDQPETSEPNSIVTDGGSNLWIIDQSSATIRRVNRDPIYATLGVFNLAFTALQDGTAGNNLTIKFEFKGDGLPDVDVTGNDIVITVFNQTGLAREFQIANAVNADPVASTLIRAFAGSPSAIHNYNQAPYNAPMSFSGGTDHQLGTIDVSASGLPVAGIFANGNLWVTMNNGDLLKIDTGDTLLDTFPSGASALGGITRGPAQYLHMVETAPDDKVRTFDYNDEYFVEIVPAGNNPDDVAVDFNVNAIYAIDRTSSLIRKLDRFTGALLTTIDITGFGLPRRGVVIGNNLWVATSTGFFIAIDTPSDTIVSSNRTGQLLNDAAPQNLGSGVDAVAATLTTQAVTYTANTDGNAGNFITASYTGGATAGSEVVTVVPQAPGTIVSMPSNRGLDITFDGTDMWVAGYPDNELTRISPDGFTKRLYSNFYDVPVATAWDGANLWVVTESGLTRLDPTTDLRMNVSLNGNTSPRAIAYDGLADATDLASGVPGGNMWVTNANSGFIYKVTTDGLITEFALSQTTAIAFDGTNMWIARNQANMVTKVTPAGVMTDYPVTGNPWDIAFDGVNMWTANDDSSVSKIDPSGVETNYPGLSGPATGIAFDGTDMWTADRGSGGFSRIDPSGTITSYAGPGPQFAKIAFDGEFMWAQADATDDLARVAALGAGPATNINTQIEAGVSTAQNVVDAVNGLPAAAALVTASTGAGGTLQSVAGYIPLAGGIDAVAAIYHVEGAGFYIDYTAVTPGTVGNAITIEYTAGGTAGSEIVSVVGDAISIQIESGVSKYQQVADAVNAFPAAAALVTVTTNSYTASALTGITRDDGSNFYLSDPTNKLVYRVDPNNGLQTMAQFVVPNTPDDIAFDGGGSLWSLDLTSTRIRRFDTSGQIFGGPSVAADGGLPRRMANELPSSVLFVTMDTGHILLLDAYSPAGGITRTLDTGAAGDLSGIYTNNASFYISAAGTTDAIALLFYDGGFYKHVIETMDLGNPADRITIGGNWFWTTNTGVDFVRKVNPANGSTAVSVSTAAEGSPLDIAVAGSILYITASNGKVMRLNMGLEQATAALTIQDLTFTSNTPGVAGNLFNVEYTDGATLGAANVTFYDGTRLVVQIDSGVTTAENVRQAIINTTGDGAFTTIVSGNELNQQTAPVAQTFFAGGGDIAATMIQSVVSGKSALAGISESMGWASGPNGPAVGFTSPSDGYLRLIANGLPSGVGDGFFYIGTVIFDGGPQRMAADATDLWVCDESGTDAPFRIGIASMDVIAHITGAFGGNNGAITVAIGGGFVYFGDNNFPTVHKIDPATNARVRPLNVGDGSGGNQFARVQGLFYDGSALWITCPQGSNFGTRMGIQKFVGDHSVAWVPALDGDQSGNHHPMVKVGDALFVRMNNNLHRLNTNLG